MKLPFSKHALRSFDKKELQYLQEYRQGTGGVQSARRILIDHLQLAENAEASNIPVTKNAMRKALIAARLVLVYRKLGEPEKVKHYLSLTVEFAKKDVEEEKGYNPLRNKTDEEIGAKMVELVTKLDAKWHLKWQQE